MTDITRYRGDTFPIVFSILDSSSNPLDISGFTFLLSVDTRKSPDDVSTQLFQLAGAIVGAGSNGIVQFLPTAANTDLDPATYYFDAQLIDGSSYIRTFDKGKFKIVQDITK